MQKEDLNRIPWAQIGGVRQAYKPNTGKAERRSKVLPSLQSAVKACGLKDGMTISFHHHFRSGDHLVNQVIDVIAEMGIKNLTLAASSLSDVHAPLIRHIENGVIRRIETSGLRGQLADAISHGLMDLPVIFRSHGSRAEAIDSGELKIDVAFLGAPSCDACGNANGIRMEADDELLCGSLGYAIPDVRHAGKTVILTQKLVPYPNLPFVISQTDVDYVVELDDLGDPKGIMSGATRFTKNPKELLIAENCSRVIQASGYFKDGFSLQMGTGGASLATARFLADAMRQQHIQARFALGGITQQMIEMQEEGLIDRVMDVQSFDLGSAASLKNGWQHTQISASHYASSGSRQAAVNQLDIVILSALEIDTQFNVNVLTGSDGVIRGAIGGHSDTAAGAQCSIIVAPLLRGRIPTVRRSVQTIITPGSTVDILVTDRGIAVNPGRPDLMQKLIQAKLPLRSIEDLQQEAEALTGIPDPIKTEEKIVGVVLYRDGTVLDVIHQVKE